MKNVQIPESLFNKLYLYFATVHDGKNDMDGGELAQLCMDGLAAKYNAMCARRAYSNLISDNISDEERALAKTAYQGYKNQKD